MILSIKKIFNFLLAFFLFEYGLYFFFLARKENIIHNQYVLILNLMFIVFAACYLVYFLIKHKEDILNYILQNKFIVFIILSSFFLIAFSNVSVSSILDSDNTIISYFTKTFYYIGDYYDHYLRTLTLLVSEDTHLTNVLFPEYNYCYYLFFYFITASFAKIFSVVLSISIAKSIVLAMLCMLTLVFILFCISVSLLISVFEGKFDFKLDMRIVWYLILIPFTFKIFKVWSLSNIPTKMLGFPVAHIDWGTLFTHTTDVILKINSFFTSIIWVPQHIFAVCILFLFAGEVFSKNFKVSRLILYFFSVYFISSQVFLSLLVFCTTYIVYLCFFNRDKNIKPVYKFSFLDTVNAVMVLIPVTLIYKFYILTNQKPEILIKYALNAYGILNSFFGISQDYFIAPVFNIINFIFSIIIHMNYEVPLFLCLLLFAIWILRKKNLLKTFESFSLLYILFSFGVYYILRFDAGYDLDSTYALYRTIYLAWIFGIIIIARGIFLLNETINKYCMISMNNFILLIKKIFIFMIIILGFLPNIQEAIFHASAKIDVLNRKDSYSVVIDKTDDKLKYIGVKVSETLLEYKGFYIYIERNSQVDNLEVDKREKGRILDIIKVDDGDKEVFVNIDKYPRCLIKVLVIPNNFSDIEKLNKQKFVVEVYRALDVYEEKILKEKVEDRFLEEEFLDYIERFTTLLKNAKEINGEIYQGVHKFELSSTEPILKSIMYTELGDNYNKFLLKNYNELIKCDYVYNEMGIFNRLSSMVLGKPTIMADKKDENFIQYSHSDKVRKLVNPKYIYMNFETFKFEYK
ncbi:hypothetical protein ACFL4A_00620 [bacterium]